MMMMWVWLGGHPAGAKTSPRLRPQNMAAEGPSRLTVAVEPPLLHSAVFHSLYLLIFLPSGVDNRKPSSECIVFISAEIAMYRVIVLVCSWEILCC